MSSGVGRMVGVLTGVGLFLSTTALGAPQAESIERIPETSAAVAVATGSTLSVVALDVDTEAEPVSVVDPVDAADTVASSTTGPSTSTTTQPDRDPTGEEIIAHHATTTIPGDVVTAIIDGSDGLWSSGMQLSSVVPSDALPILPDPSTTEECYERARSLSLTGENPGNLIAQMTHSLFECVARVEGLGDVDPTSIRRWDGRKVWGFQSLAEQVAAEAVTVAYCESVGFKRSALRGSNPWGYAGLFQIGKTEFRRFSGMATNRYDPVDNAYAAARYFLHQYGNRAGWGGWSPWAVVNTNFDGINDQVKVPILPRFSSTQPGYRGRYGPELPAWAVDPWTYRVPDWSGCPYTGGRWSASDKL